MRIIIIDPEERIVTVSTIPDDDDEQLPAAQLIVGGFIERVPQAHMVDDLYVNEEGLLQGELHTKHWFVFGGYPKALVGNGVIIGSKGENWADAKITLHRVKALVQWRTFKQIREYQPIVRRRWTFNGDDNAA